MALNFVVPRALFFFLDEAGQVFTMLRCSMSRSTYKTRHLITAIAMSQVGRFAY
jgi:hypothetical protein